MSSTYISKILESPTKSLSDKKLYRMIELPNGMKSLLVQHFIEENEPDDADDCGKEKLAAVALCIDIGSFADPNEVQGLSHFLEHMIFMGSEKYPKENDYDLLMSEHGGSRNGFTQWEHTVFYFDIVKEKLEKAMDILSQLFVSPLILRESMEKEIKSVESEFQNGVNNDDSRIQQLCASLANGPASVFSWGNLKSLKGQEVSSHKLYEILHEFRRKHYLANKMYLCVESSSSLDELQKLVEEKFSAVPSGQIVEPFEVPPKAFKPEFFDKVYYVKPKSDSIKLFIKFLLPSMEKHYRSKPHNFIKYLIEHEGEGSLFSHLTKRLLALKVEAGSTNKTFDGNSMFSLFSIDITLTENGYEHLNDVLETIFSYIHMLKITPFEEREKRFMEIKKIKEIQFRFKGEKSPTDNVIMLAMNMKYFSQLDVINGDDIYLDYDPLMIQQIIDQLNEGRFNLMILSNKHEKYTKTEKWFGTEYDATDFPEAYKNLWRDRKLNSNLSLPSPNEFICSNFDILCEKLDSIILSQEPQVPQKIAENDIYECYHKLDTVFKLPRAFIYANFISPTTLESRKNKVMSLLYSIIAEYYLAEDLYPAKCAGFNHEITSEEKGIHIKLSGYNEKLPLLLEIVINKLKSIGELDLKVFETFKQQCRRNRYNRLVELSRLNDNLGFHVVEEHHSFDYDEYREIENVTFENFKSFCEIFLKSLKVQFLFQGNISKETSLETVEKAMKNLNCSAVSANVTLESRARKLPVGTSVLSIRNMLKNDKNSFIANHVQVGQRTMKMQCLVEFVQNITDEPIYYILRTQEQLGYDVSCSHRSNNGILGFTVAVQSQETKNPLKMVNERIEKFLHGKMLEIIEQMTDEQFEKHQTSLIKLKNVVDHELETEVIRNFSEITSREYLFNRMKLEADTFARLTTTDVIEFYKNYIIGENARKLSVQVIGFETEVEIDQNEETVANLQILQPPTPGYPIDDITEFKRSLEMYPITKTLIE